MLWVLRTCLASLSLRPRLWQFLVPFVTLFTLMQRHHQGRRPEAYPAPPRVAQIRSTSPIRYSTSSSAQGPWASLLPVLPNSNLRTAPLSHTYLLPAARVFPTITVPTTPFLPSPSRAHPWAALAVLILHLFLLFFYTASIPETPSQSRTYLYLLLFSSADAAPNIVWSWTTSRTFQLGAQ
ncbi:hypothetical protein B0T25DRAFT_218147 [Lasiosphaeria hispida]|uniref:Uncharacterized protein n=1 Tax=Lasiosphaeria hispida TaxID=260671 RepID=A0AAJ0HJ57_9PEZI|nr:hypothetical protein B0T25DRAFT_218147 [Lasiosphaeria hispida]